MNWLTGRMRTDGRSTLVKRARAILIVVMALAAVAAAGCGGGSSEPEGPTKAEFIAKADAACAPFNARAKVLLGQVGSNAVNVILGGGSVQQFAPLLDEAVALATKANRTLQAIEPPQTEQGGAVAMQRSLDEQLVRLTDLRNAARIDDLGTFQRVGTMLLAEQQRTARLQQSYGFRECGKSLTEGTAVDRAGSGASGGGSSADQP